MNFAYGVIVIVGILVAISIGFIIMDPNFIIEPRVVEEKPSPCTLEWIPMCGIDGVTYGNLCMLNAADIKLAHKGECSVDAPIVKPRVETMEKEISVHPNILTSVATVGDSLSIEVEFRSDDGIIVDHVNYDIFATQDGNTILSEIGSHRHPGKHPIHETKLLGESDVEIKVIIQGLGHDEEITGPKGHEHMITVTPQVSQVSVSSGMVVVPETYIVSTSQGSSIPGCEDTNSCYLPYEITISAGDKVTWINDDSATHTVTSGNIPDGTDGVFDSGLFMAGTTFEFTFDKAATYDYFCLVHPWMTGKVIVNEVKDMIISEPESMSIPTKEEPSSELEMMDTTIVSIPIGVAVPGCEDTNSCYLPYEITISAGDKVTWINDDSATHTVTSGNASAGFTGVFDSGLFMAGTTFEFTFDKAATYDYFCLVHPWMTGKITVT
ncbi:MAG: plastocyanin/azurin family copper-binding protein [Nitrosopumilus sp.]|nr:plastocyanin/azurin family copper-binding protein [Nitrosopumilus sp.]MDH3489525.1 plastocyanin/azurin family copper-binding protein [Nitrosopumilus sp.]MDH3516523.1 plastocyanin/azurin family copper-binding protein [Nitrosopumilus sp.]MDH3564989.1 plastocyanin/azurin family copper-binding protein [Nitrosopumilus sp.]MDH5416412.1 plastocyanin/azurin family copper-binding protein [Nitrosopumilus sp.]